MLLFFIFIKSAQIKAVCFKDVYKIQTIHSSVTPSSQVSTVTMVILLLTELNFKNDINDHAASGKKKGILSPTTVFWLVNLMGRNYLEDLGVAGRIILEWILGKYSGKVWSRFI